METPDQTFNTAIILYYFKCIDIINYMVGLDGGMVLFLYYLMHAFSIHKDYEGRRA